MIPPTSAALAGGTHFSVTEGLCVSTCAVRFWTGSGVRAGVGDMHQYSVSVYIAVTMDDMLYGP